MRATRRPVSACGANLVRTLASILFLLLLLLPNGGCAEKRADPNLLVTSRVFAVTEGQVEFLDPNLISETAGNRVGMQMFEPLVTIAPGSELPVPAQAERWTVSDDKRTYTFVLRDGLTWSDGVPISTADFVYSYERLLNPNTQSKAAQLLGNIEGAEAYNAGKTSDFKTVGVRALDPKTLEIRFTGPAPYFLDLLVNPNFAPVPKHVIDRVGPQWTRPDHIVVNGAFRLTTWVSGERIEMVRNERYWDAKNVWLDGVTFYETQSESTAQTWYDAGKVQWSPGLIPLTAVRGLLSSGRTDFHIDPLMCVYYYCFNTTRPPFDDARVRRAFNQSVDKPLLVRQVLGMGQKPATHLVPPMFMGSRGYGEVTGDPFDPSRARKTLDSVGYNTSSPFPAVTLDYNTFEGHRIIAEFIQKALAGTLDMKLELANMEWKSLLQKVHAGDFQIARGSWCADFNDPEDFLRVFHSRHEHNYAKYSSPEYDALLDALAKTGDQPERNRLAAEAEAMLNRDQPIIPLYFYTRGHMLRPFVHGVEPDSQDRHYFKYVWFGAEDAKAAPP